jgi:hypothetical protein
LRIPKGHQKRCKGKVYHEVRIRQRFHSPDGSQFYSKGVLDRNQSLLEEVNQDSKDEKSMKHRTEITIDTQRLLIISRRKFAAHAWCKRCGKRVEMVTVDEAARLAQVSSRTIYGWVEVERLHFTETSEGRLLICYESIPPQGGALVRAAD